MFLAGKQTAKILTGLAGEYHVAAELCRRGFYASLTLKNYPKVDILVMHPIEQYTVPIQVKTVVRGNGKWGFFVPKDAASYQGLFVFVLLGNDEQPYETFIMTPGEVAERAERARREYTSSAPHALEMREEDQFLMLREEQLMDRRKAWNIVADRLRAERFLWHEGEVEFTPNTKTEERRDALPVPPWWEELRQQYKPDKVKYLIIGESAPSGGTFFYSGNSTLYRRTLEVFRQVHGEKCGEGEGFLRWFADHGWWLLDLCDTPVNDMPTPERRRVRRESVPKLAEKLGALRPELVVITPLSIEREAKRALREAGLDGVRVAAVPFPQMGWQGEFQRTLLQLVRELEA